MKNFTLNEIIGICLALLSGYFTYEGLTTLCGDGWGVRIVSVVLQFAYFRIMAQPVKGSVQTAKKLALVAMLYVINSAGHFGFLKGQFDLRMQSVNEGRLELAMVADQLEAAKGVVVRYEGLVAQETARGGFGKVAKGYAQERDAAQVKVEALQARLVQLQAGISAGLAKFQWVQTLAGLLGVSFDTVALAVIGAFAMSGDIAAGLLLGHDVKKTTVRRAVRKPVVAVEKAHAILRVVKKASGSVKSVKAPKSVKRPTAARKVLGKGLGQLLMESRGLSAIPGLRK